MLPAPFISGLQKHIAICYGDRAVRTLFYGQTVYQHPAVGGGLAHWQAALLESSTTDRHDLHFFVGETDEHSGAFGRTVPYVAPLAINGLDPEHRATIGVDGSVEVIIGGEMLARTVAR